MERQDTATGEWTVSLDDGDWDTIFDWKRPHTLEGSTHTARTNAAHTGTCSLAPTPYLDTLSVNVATVIWHVGATQEVVPGTYRLRHFGVHVNLLGTKKDYSGTSSSFEVKHCHPGAFLSMYVCIIVCLLITLYA